MNAQKFLDALTATDAAFRAIVGSLDVPQHVQPAALLALDDGRAYIALGRDSWTGSAVGDVRPGASRGGFLGAARRRVVRRAARLVALRDRMIAAGAIVWRRNPANPLNCGWVAV